MRSVLVLVTAPDAAILADGAILVRRELSSREDGTQGDAHWTVQDSSHQVVAMVIQDLGSRLERWQLASVADRELRIVSDTGAVIATIHQRSQANRTLP
jgi:hypothetical protein